MKKSLGLLSLLPFIFFAARAQEISGTWSGILNVENLQKLTLIFHVKDSAGELSATMDSPDQHASGIPVSQITFSDSDLHIEVGNGVIIYDGKLKSNSIKGTFKQNGMTFPLTLHKGTVHKKKVVRPQQPKPPFPYESKKVKFINKQADVTLAGSLTIPKQGHFFPAVILIAGSGPNDRDETIAEHKPFLVIADDLSRKGIAVLRYDKRGIGQSGGEYHTATTADFASDAEAAVQYLKSLKDINAQKVGLIGHSEGAIIAAMAASVDSGIAFIVLLAGPGYDGAKLLLMQEKAIGKAGGLSAKKLDRQEKENRALFQMIIKTKDPDSLSSALSERIRNHLPDNLSPQQKEKRTALQVAQLTTPWMRYFLSNNPAEYLKKVHCPVLAMDGTKDLQVPAEKNITAIKKALTEGGNREVTTKIFPGLNHLFQEAKTGLPSEYGTIEQTFSPKALDFMSNWIWKQIQN